MEIRKFVTTCEDTLLEAGRPTGRVVRKAVCTAVVRNPAAGSYRDDLSELEARVRALVRRSMGGTSSQLRHGPLTYDQVGRMAFLNDQPIDLSARELGVLEILLQRPGRLVSKEQIVNHLCEWGEEVSHNAIEVYVHRLRKKLEPGGVRIATVRGLGYCLEKPQENRGA